MENEIKKMKKFLVLSGIMFLLGSIAGYSTMHVEAEHMKILVLFTYLTFIAGSVLLMLAGVSKKK